MDSVSYDTQYKNLQTRTRRYDTVRYSTGKYTSLNEKKTGTKTTLQYKRQDTFQGQHSQYKRTLQHRQCVQCNTDNAYNATQYDNPRPTNTDNAYNATQDNITKTAIQDQQTHTMRTMLQCPNTMRTIHKCPNRMRTVPQCPNTMRTMRLTP